MPVEIGHDEVQHQTAAGAYLLDVREREGYDAEHLPGAVSLPIKSLDQQTRFSNTELLQAQQIDFFEIKFRIVSRLQDLSSEAGQHERNV